MDQKIIIESLLTGSQFEIAINEHDKVSIVKMNIQKMIGIPSNQLHLLHNQVELNDSTSLKDIPNFQNGLKLKLVLGMKGGPISSSRRVPLTDYDSLFDDVMNQASKREEPLTIKTTKYLVYKGCKKNVHRLWKMNGGGGSSGGIANEGNGKGKNSASTANTKYGKASSLFGGGGMNGRGDDDKIKKMTDQTIQENIRTTEKINQLRLKMELVNARKKLKSIKFPIKSGGKKLSSIDDKQCAIGDMEKPQTATPTSSPTLVRTKDGEKIKLRNQSERNFLSAESKMKIKENLSRNRSFKTILTQPNAISSSTSSMSLFNNEINPLEFCFSSNEIGSGSKLGRSLSFQLTPAAISSNGGGVCNRDYTSTSKNSSGSALKMSAEAEKIDMFKGTTITKLSPTSAAATTSTAVDEYFILPKLLIREDSPPAVLESPLGIVKESKTEELLDIATGKQPSAESLIEFYENLTSSSTSSLASKNDYDCFHHPSATSNRFYHSDLDLNQLNDRFKNTLSISNHNINTSEGNLGGGTTGNDWPRSNLLLLSINQTSKDESTQASNSDYHNLIDDVNYDKFLNDLLNNSSNDLPPAVQIPCGDDDEHHRDEMDKKTDSEVIDLFGNSMTKKSTRRIAPMKKPMDKLKSFSSNPQLGASNSHYSLKGESSSNLTATATTSTTTVHHIPQLPRLDAIPTKYRRGYINLNDACLSSSSDLTTKLPKTPTDCHRKLSLKDPIPNLASSNSNSSFHHGASIFHCRSDTTQQPQPQPHSSNAFDCFGGSNSSGRQSRFEYCNSYYSNLNQFAAASNTHKNKEDFQSEENLFNMNFDSFYEDFVDSSAESWSSTSSASSTSFDSSSISSMYDKKYVILPEIKLDNELMRLDKAASDDKALMVATGKEQQEKDPASSGKLRCYHCNKKLGIIMIMKCHCNQYFCSAHRYMEVHNCSYDYKENGRKEISRENPLVCTEKLPKI